MKTTILITLIQITAIILIASCITYFFNIEINKAKAVKYSLITFSVEVVTLVGYYFYKAYKEVR